MANKKGNKPGMIAFLMHLGTNNWRKKDYDDGTYLDIEDFVYRDKMFCDKEVWKDVTSKLPEFGINTLWIDVEDGIVYDKHPEISIPGAWSKAELKEELDRLRSMGITPLPKCNFSNGHSAWLKDYAYIVGTEKYNQICSDIVEELIELFDTPEYFHLGLEEEDFHSQLGQPIAIIRAPFKKAEDANRLFDVCRVHGVRPVIWSNAGTVEAFGGDEAFQKHVAKDVVLMPYSYGILRFNATTCKDYKFAEYCCKFQEWGYESILCGSTWSWHLANKDIIRFATNFLDMSKIIGFISAPWMLTTKRKYYALLNDAANLGNAINDIYEEDYIDKNLTSSNWSNSKLFTEE